MTGDLLGSVFLGAFLVGLLSTLGMLALGAGHHGGDGHGGGAHGGHGGGVVGAVDLVGTVARVVATVGERRTGEIVFSHGGKRHALPARVEAAGVSIDRGAEVVIMRVERGIAWVERASDVFANHKEKEKP